MWGRMGVLPHKSWRWNFDVPADFGGHRLARSIAILDISWMASRMFLHDLFARVALRHAAWQGGKEWDESAVGFLSENDGVAHLFITITS